MSWSACASKRLSHQLSTMTSERCGVEQLHSSRQPSATKQNSGAAWKSNPDTKQDNREAEWGRDANDSEEEGRVKMPIAKLS